jgi:hypothetical protein
MPRSAARAQSHVPTRPSPRPELWEEDAGEADVAQLEVPADAERERRFVLSCSFTVSHAQRGEAWHELRVLVNGLQEWSRREPTHTGEHDSLDVSFRRTVPVGEALRLNATTRVAGARRLGLKLSAEEEA